MTLCDQPLCDELVQGILATGYTAPTEIQAEAIPIAIEGKDMIGCAQTGNKSNINMVAS